MVVVLVDAGADAFYLMMMMMIGVFFCHEIVDHVVVAHIVTEAVIGQISLNLGVAHFQNF